jgi:hypothetical protein
VAKPFPALPWVRADEAAERVTAAEPSVLTLPSAPHTRLGTTVAGTDGNMWFAKNGLDVTEMGVAALRVGLLSERHEAVLAGVGGQARPRRGSSTSTASSIKPVGSASIWTVSIEAWPSRAAFRVRNPAKAATPSTLRRWR